MGGAGILDARYGRSKLSGMYRVVHLKSSDHADFVTIRSPIAQFFLREVYKDPDIDHCHSSLAKTSGKQFLERRMWNHMSGRIAKTKVRAFAYP